MNISGIQQSFFTLVQQPASYSHNIDFLLLFINHIHLASKSNTMERLFFGTLFENGNLDIKRACLIRLQSILCNEMNNEEFITWCLPYLFLCLDACESITILVVTILDDIITLSPFIHLVVLGIAEYSRKLEAVIRLPECEEFLTKIIGTEDGFQVLEECYDYVTTRFDSFMESGIYQYVRNMENEFTAGLLQNPSNCSVSPFYLDRDSTLLVNPLRIQPPQNEILYMLRDEHISIQWLLEIPWRIESVLCSKQNELRLNVDCSIDLNIPHLQASGEDSIHSTIHLHGVFTNIQTNSIQTIELQEGDELKICLQIGCESISYNYLGSDFKSCNTNTIQVFKQFVGNQQNDYIVCYYLSFIHCIEFNS